jgi:hypothetical protein
MPGDWCQGASVDDSKPPSPRRPPRAGLHPPARLHAPRHEARCARRWGRGRRHAASRARRSRAASGREAPSAPRPPRAGGLAREPIAPRPQAPPGPSPTCRAAEPRWPLSTPTPSPPPRTRREPAGQPRRDQDRRLWAGARDTQPPALHGIRVDAVVRGVWGGDAAPRALRAARLWHDNLGARVRMLYRSLAHALAHARARMPRLDACPLTSPHPYRPGTAPPRCCCARPTTARP